MITIEQVIEQCALEAVCLRDDLLQSDGKFNEGQMFAAEEIATRIRALAAQYEGCIVAEGSAAIMLFQDEDDVNQIIGADSHPSIVEMLEAKPLYRAREAK